MARRTNLTVALLALCLLAWACSDGWIKPPIESLLLEESDFPEGWYYKGQMDTGSLFCMPFIPCYDYVRIATAEFSSYPWLATQEIDEYANLKKATEVFEKMGGWPFGDDLDLWIPPQGLDTQNFVADHYKIGCEAGVCRMVAQYQVYVVDFFIRADPDMDINSVNEILETLDANMLPVSGD